MLVRIKDFRILEDYKMLLRFTNGEEGEANFKDCVGKGVFTDWTDYNNFRKVNITHNGRVLEWEGERDFCADSLYLQVTGKTQEEYAAY